MASSSARTVTAYLAELPAARRTVVRAVRDVVRANLPSGYEEMMGYGMIVYAVPLERFPHTYNGQPLGCVAIAAQKNFYALYLMGLLGQPELADAFEAEVKSAGKKLGESRTCVRFARVDDLALDAVARVIGSTPPETLMRIHDATHSKEARAARAAARAKKSAKTPATKKRATAKKTVAKKVATKTAAKRKR